MKRLLVIRRRAEADLAEAKHWYEEQKPGLGFEFMEELASTLQVVEARPYLFPAVHGEFRRALLRRFPYAVYYLVLPKRIRVVACLHGKRDPGLLVERLRKE